MAKKMGRPPLSPGQAKDEYIQLRLTAGERDAYEQAAKDKGMSLSEWIRWHLNRAGTRKHRR